MNELVAWNRLFLFLRTVSLSLFLSVAVDRFAPSHDNRMHALSLACGLLRYGVAYSVASGWSRSKPVGGVCSHAVRRASTSSFRQPLDLSWSSLRALFLSVIFFGVSSTFSSRYLTDRRRARSRCSSGPHVCWSTRQLAQPRVFWRRSGSGSHGRMSLATESGLRESGEMFHVEEKKVAALRDRASSRA